MMFTAVREMWRGSRAARPGNVRTRVTLPAVVEPPQDVLRAVRLLDDAFDVYVLPDGRVWLLKYEANKPRIQEGRKILAQARELGDYSDLEAAHLMSEGWSLMAELSYQEGMSVGAVCERAQMTLYATKAEIEADQLRRKEIADGTTGRREAVRLVKDRVRADAKSDHARLRGRSMFSYHKARR